MHKVPTSPKICASIIPCEIWSGSLRSHRRTTCNTNRCICVHMGHISTKCELCV